MTPQPKPVPRPKAAPKRIARRKPLARASKPIARKSRPRPMRKGTTAEMRREANGLWSRLIFVINGWYCFWCAGRATDSAHLLARGSWPGVRHDLKNGIPLCRGCHSLLGEARVVGHSPLRNLYISIRGRSVWDALVARASQKARPISETLEYLRRVAKEMGIK